MTDLDNDALVAGALDKRGRRRAVHCDRLLNEDMDAGVDEIARDRMVERRRHRDGDGVDPADQVAMIGKGGGPRLRNEGRTACYVGIGERDQICGGMAGVVARMVAPEGAKTHDSHVHALTAGHAALNPLCPRSRHPQANLDGQQRARP
jgi:hypothetical protein